MQAYKEYTAVWNSTAETEESYSCYLLLLVCFIEHFTTGIFQTEASAYMIPRNKFYCMNIFPTSLVYTGDQNHTNTFQQEMC